jgi:hypothetical protein
MHVNTQPSDDLVALRSGRRLALSAGGLRTKDAVSEPEHTFSEHMDV